MSEPEAEPPIFVYPGSDPATVVPAGKPFPGLLQSFGLLALILVIANGVAVLILLPGALQDYLSHGGLTRPLPFATIGIVANSLAFGIVTWLAFKWSRMTPAEAFPLRPVGAGAWLTVAMLFGAAVVTALLVLAALLFILPPPPEVVAIFQQLLGEDTPLWAAIVFLVIVAPITEEFFFRGVLQHGLRRRYGRGKSILWSGILFGLIHGLPWQILPATVLGLVFAFWTDRTGSLWPALVAHAVNNGTQLAISKLNPQSDLMDPEWPDPVLVGTGIVMMVIGSLLARRFLKPGEPETVVERSFS